MYIFTLYRITIYIIVAETSQYVFSVVKLIETILHYKVSR